MGYATDFKTPDNTQTNRPAGLAPHPFWGLKQNLIDLVVICHLSILMGWSDRGPPGGHWDPSRLLRSLTAWCQMFHNDIVPAVVPFITSAWTYCFGFFFSLHIYTDEQTCSTKLKDKCCQQTQTNVSHHTHQYVLS